MNTLKLETLTVSQLTAPHADPAVARTLITAKMARQLVDQEGKHLKQNRPLSAPTIEAYRRDMVGKRWQGFNGTSLSFNTEGKAIDGEHRLRGLARITDDDFGVEFVVFFGVSDDARKTMDVPRIRSAADEFNMAGAGKLGIKLTAALRALAIMGSGQGSGGRMSKPALEQLNEQHPRMLECVKHVMDVDREDQVPVRPALITALYYAAKYLMDMPKQADDMLSVMRSGDKAYDGDPMHAWREFVIKTGDRKKLAEAELVRGTVKAWNLFAKGTALTGRFSIPASQALIDGLSIKLVYGDMVEGYLLSQPKEEPEAAPVKATKGSPKAATAIKPLKGDKEDATPEAAPTAQAQGNGTPEFAAAKAAIASNDKARAEEALQAEELAAKAAKRGKTPQPAPVPDAVH